MFIRGYPTVATCKVQAKSFILYAITKKKNQLVRALRNLYVSFIILDV